MWVCKYLHFLVVLRGRSLGGVGFGVVLWALCVSVDAATSRYQAPLDLSSWAAKSSVFECRLSHEIPFYGAAAFVHEAGEDGMFQLIPQDTKLAAGEAKLMSQMPLWKHSGLERTLGMVKVKKGVSMINVGSKESAGMLEELFAGQQLVFSRKAWFESERDMDVVLSPINFRGAYEEYQGCLTGLLPVNFDQINRTAIYFQAGIDDLPKAEVQKLDHIATYVKADKSIKAFYIDGHTDSSGTRTENLDLSQQRAEFIMRQLVERGISKDKIVVRWHGERYPVASNRSASGREKNRRVTVRLEKTVPVKSSPVAAKPASDT